MIYRVKLQFDPDDLIQAYCDNQGVPIDECDLDVESILEQEISSWTLGKKKEIITEI